MEINTDQLMENALRDGIREGLRSRFSAGYNNPLDKLVEAAISAHGDKFRALLNESLLSCFGDEKFRDDIRVAVRGQLAKTLIQRFGGELEKQVNTLKSDPATRARITLAIEAIVKEKCEPSLQTA